MSQPPYSERSLAELVVLRQRTNKWKFSQEYQEIAAEIKHRQANLTDDEQENFRRKMRHNNNVRLFSTFFLLAGFLVLILFCTPAFISLCESRSWVVTPCTIAHQPSGQSPSITYRYTIRNRRYTSNRLEFYPSQRDQWFRDKYPNNTTATCLVNPYNPKESVLIRYWETLFFIFIWSLSALGFGIFGFLYPERVGGDTKHPNPWTKKEINRLTYHL